MNFSRLKKLKAQLLIISMTLAPLSSSSAADQNPFKEPRESTKAGTASLSDLNTIIQPNDQTLPSAQLNFDVPPKQPEQFIYSFPTATQSGPTNNELIKSVSNGVNSSAKPQDDFTKTALINFNDVNIIEYIRFVSRISNKNFIFNDDDLKFNVTIVSEEPITISNIMTALLYELRIHDLSLIEDSDNFIIHKNPKVNGISQVVSNGLSNKPESSIITRVFLLDTLDPEKAAEILRPLSSENAMIEPLKESNYLIVTDLASNIEKISQLLKSIDASNSGIVVGQYQSIQIPIDELIQLTQQIMAPIAQNQMYVLVPHRISNSIFIIASPYLVERSIMIFEHLEQGHGDSGILDLNQFKNRKHQDERIARSPSGSWLQDNKKNWIFNPATQDGSDRFTPPSGKWTRDYEGNWSFTNGNFPLGGTVAPKGKWVQDEKGNWIFELDKEEFINTETITRGYEQKAPVPIVPQKVTQFYIHKLQYRKGDTIMPMLSQFAEAIKTNQKGNEDLIGAISSVGWLNVPNSLAFSGTVEALEEIRALLSEIDTPMRQVFVEMLILETTMADNLNYGVSYGTRFGGGNTSGGEGFSVGPITPLGVALATTGVTGLGSAVNAAAPAVALVPNGTNLGFGDGFNLGIIGQKITHCGTEFASIGALVHALHNRSSDKVVSNPKLLIENNAHAEIFVGENTPYRTQSISNSAGAVLTSNYEYRDVGTRLRLTPYIGNSDIIALDLEEEISKILSGAVNNFTVNTSPGPTTELNRTVTRVHIPNEYFLVISGMIRNEELRDRNQVPCLGGIPLIGGAFSKKTNADNQRNLIIFIRPKIIDTEEEIQNITKRQQDIYRYNNSQRNITDYEVSETLDLLNLDRTLHPEGYDENYCEMKRAL